MTKQSLGETLGGPFPVNLPRYQVEGAINQETKAALGEHFAEVVIAAFRLNGLEAGRTPTENEIEFSVSILRSLPIAEWLSSRIRTIRQGP